MTKVFNRIVDCCVNCPTSEAMMDANERLTLHCNEEQRFINELDGDPASEVKIPDWCPLEDWK